MRDGIQRIGANTIEAVDSVGFIARAVLDGIKRPSRLVIGETIRQVHSCGVAAIPIVTVICFLMGVVLAYQSARQLEQFGANIFMVDLVANADPARTRVFCSPPSWWPAAPARPSPRHSAP